MHTNNKYSFLKTFSLSALIIGLSLVGAQAAFAASFEDPSATLGLGTADLVDVVVNIINWALGLIGLLGVIFVIYGGYLWLTAAGNEERVAKAKRIILNAVIGLVIILLSWAIVNYILKLGQDISGGSGGDNQCTPGEISGCYTCNEAGGWDYHEENPGCQLYNDAFSVTNITTSCGNGTDFQNDVFRCSAVQINFNHAIDTSATSNLKQLIEVTDQNVLALKVAQCDDGAACTRISQPTPLFHDPAPTILYSGSRPTGTTAEFVSASKSLSFFHQHELFAENTYYRLFIPKSIKDSTGKQLTVCTAPGCQDNGSTEFTWTFQVGTKTDTEAPVAVSSYPTFKTDDPSYPDRNVNRSPIIWVRFSEPMAGWTTANPDNVQVYPYTIPPDAEGNGGTLADDPLPAANYTLADTENGFELRFNAPFQLDAFAWYQIQVHDMQDLCSNVQSPSPLTWTFQTNSVGAGISQVYPANGFDKACPNTEVFVSFNTSMYDPATGSCAVHPSLGGFVTAGSAFPPRNPLEVEDDLPPGSEADPNQFCHKYSWQPTSVSLATNTAFNAHVDTRLPIDQNGSLLTADWSFRTSEPGKCANAPYIDRLDPSVGPAGRCMSVIGNYFDDAPPAGQGPNDSLTFKDPNGGFVTPPVGSWSRSTIVTNAPDIASRPRNFASAVQVNVDYGGTIGVLSSDPNNPRAQYLYSDDAPYDGPCLYSLNPDQGFRGNGFDYTGERFNKDASVQKVHFGEDLACPGPVCWFDDTRGHTNVPAAATENAYSDVSVENDKGESNAIRYFVDQLVPGTFQVVDYVPNCAGNTSCLNAAVAATFSHTLSAATVTGWTSGTNTRGSVELFACDDQTCAQSTLDDGHEVQVNLQYPGGKEVDFAPLGGLRLNTWYRAVIHGGETGVASTDAKQLGNLNFDFDGNGNADAFSWTFGTAPSADQCGVSSIDCKPASTAVGIGKTGVLEGHVYAAPNSCGTTELDRYAYQWTWRSDDQSRVGVAATTKPSATMTGLAETASPVNVHDSTEGKDAFCAVSVSTSTCQTDTDCASNARYGDGVSCPGSTCNQATNTCTPVVTDIDPKNGAVGTWVTVSGCYFDNYVDGRSKVYFLQNSGTSTDDKLAVWPEPGICGGPHMLWHDNQVIVEVPQKATTEVDDDVTVAGKVRLVRGTDDALADSADDFTPNGTIYPGICNITPSTGRAGVDKVKIQGQLFDAPPPGADDSDPFFAQHSVTFYNNQKVNGTTATWKSDELIENMTVPQYATNLQSTGKSEVYVSTPRGLSNPYKNFSVIPIACNVCFADAECGGGSQQGCSNKGAYSCCADRPQVASTAPTGAAVCRNAAITVTFQSAVTRQPIPMNKSSITPGTVRVRNLTTGTDVTVDSNELQLVTSSKLLISPLATENLPLDRNSTYQVTIVGGTGGVLTTENVGMTASYQWQFTTADTDSVCQIDRVALEPDSWIFTTVGQVQQFTAEAFDVDGSVIVPLYGVYDWEWQWKSDDDQIVSVTQIDGDLDTHIDPDQDATAVANGGTTIRATATSGIGWTGSRTGTASVSVAACVSPWPVPPDSVPFTDSATNFSTWYCRDHGTSVCSGNESLTCSADAECASADAGSCLFAAVNTTSGDGTYTPGNGTDELLRQFFFEYPYENAVTHKKDAIGILVWENEEHLSPTDWYKKKFQQSPGAALLTADGYQAMRVGTTTYVAGTNLVSDTLYTNMYVLGYNDDAGPETTNIFNQMLASFHINENGSDFAYSNAYGDVAYTEALTQVRSDTRRYADLASYEKTLESYNGTTASFPELTAGSYLAGMSTSAWPSWTETFGSALRSAVPDAVVPLNDPVNKFGPAHCSNDQSRACLVDADCASGGECGKAYPACSAPYESSTCWDNTAKHFSCPASEGQDILGPYDSSIYAYRFSVQESVKQYNLYAHFAYDGRGRWRGIRQNPCADAYPGSTCNCFNFALQGYNTADADLVDGTPPSTPEGLAAAPAGNSKVTLTWTASNDFGGSGVQYYKLYRSANGGASYMVLSDLVVHPTTTFQDTGLNASTTYFYKVSAVDVAGHESGLSRPASATTWVGDDIIPPGLVTDITATADASTTTLRWVNPTDSDFTGVLVYRKTGPPGFSRTDPGAALVKDVAATDVPNNSVVDNFVPQAGKEVSYGFFTYDNAPIRNYSLGAYLSSQSSDFVTEQ